MRLHNDRPLLAMANAKDSSEHAPKTRTLEQNGKGAQLTVDTHLPLLVDDGYCVLQLDVVEEAGEEDVGYANQAVVLLLVKKGVGPLEVATHHLWGELRVCE